MEDAHNWSNPAQTKNLSVLKTFQPAKFQPNSQTKQPMQQQAKPKPPAARDSSTYLDVPAATLGLIHPKQVENDDQASWDCSARSVYAPSNRSQRDKGVDPLDDEHMMFDGSVKDNDDDNICKNIYYSELTDGIEYDIEEDDFDASTFHNYNQSSHNRQYEIPPLNFSSNMLKPQHRNTGIASMSSANCNGAGQMSQGYIRSARNYNDGFERFSRFSDYHSHYGGSQLDTHEYNNNIEYDGAGPISTQQEIEAVKPRMVVATQNDFQQKFKTEMCRNWEMSKSCKFGPECTFAHGEFELLRKSHIPSNYRTKECKNFYTNLYCAYGNRCQFYHDEKPEHLRPIQKESYIKSLIEIEKLFEKLESKINSDIASLENNLQLQSDTSKRFRQNEMVLKELQEQIEEQMKNQPLKVFDQIKEAEVPKFSKTKYGNSAKVSEKQLIQSQAGNGGALSGSKKSGLGSVSKIHYGGLSNKKSGNMNINTINSASSNYNNQSARKSKAGTTQNHIYSNLSVNSLPHFHPTNKKYQAQQSKKFQGYNQQGSNIQTNDSLNQSFYSYNQYQSPNSNLKINFQIPVPQLPHIQQFFPNLSPPKPHMNEIKEIFNDGDQIVANGTRKERTNSMSLAEKIIQHAENDIQQELNKPSNQQVSSFTENMVYTHPVNPSNANNGNNKDQHQNHSFLNSSKHSHDCRQVFFNNFDFSIDTIYN